MVALLRIPTQPPGRSAIGDQVLSCCDSCFISSQDATCLSSLSHSTWQVREPGSHSTPVVDRLRQREKSEIEHSSTNVSTKNERVRNGLFTCFLARDAPRHNFRIGVWGEHGRPVGYNSRYSLLLDRGTPYCIGPGPSTAYCLPICALWAAAILSVETGLCCCHDNDFEAEFVALEAFSGPMTSGRARL